jgi:kinesin family protein 4/21/27
MHNCFKTLLSAGSYVDGAIDFDPNSRNNELPTGEHNIQDIVVSNSYGLYTTYGEKVRIWDLRYFRPIGLLGGKHHSSQIMCMATQGIDNKEMLITGSKDHYIKLYDFDSIEPTKNIGVGERATLQPPHYDGIESLAVSNSTLFSASRDMCIKKWDLSTTDPTLVHSLNRTHGSWISGLTFAPCDDNKLISASRDGALKLWSSETCAPLGSAQASKNGVHCITRNSTHLFTGSQEGNVGFWTVLSDPAAAATITI